MKFSLDKMFLCKSEVDFMGFHLVNGVIMPQNQKLKLIQELQTTSQNIETDKKNPRYSELLQMICQKLCRKSSTSHSLD